jgi:phage terminase small subunit
VPPLKLQKQEKFCLEYMISGNATNAAIVSGYSKKTAAIIGFENLRKPKIMLRIAELQAIQEQKAILTKTEANKILTELARASLTDFMELGKDGSWVNIGAETKNGRAISEIHSRTEYDKDTESPTIYTSVKIHNPVDAIKEFAKINFWYDDAPKINVNIDQRQLNVYDFTSLSDQELDILEQITRKVTPIGSNTIGGDISGTETP